MSDTGHFDLIFTPLELGSSVTGFVSCAASALLIILGFYYKIHKQVLGKMVLVVNIADFIFILPKPFAYLVPPSGLAYCRITGTISHFTLMMSFTWGVFFAN